ncbi:DUF7692 domain-containing protein [Halomicrobium salinisoli]|uniref:DUF7692 domain-containing protein n=1 Tax=Halomicrobium salinisoli TaxID=2878391 RepID=UPI001CF04E0B|nr:hypothetical protein [Halomicrobium salinisoli]
MAADDVPSSVRVRTGGENAYRFDAIESASEFYDTNRSDVIAYACDDIVRLADAIEDVLEEIDSIQERRAVAERVDRAVNFDVLVDTRIRIGSE